MNRSSVLIEVPLHHFLHLNIHLFLQFLHISHLEVALQLRKNNIGLSLRLSSFTENICLDILFQLSFEIVIIFKFKLKIITVIMLNSFSGPLITTLIFDRNNSLSVGWFFAQWRFNSWWVAGFDALRFVRKRRLAHRFNIVDKFFMIERLKLLLVGHELCF